MTTAQVKSLDQIDREQFAPGPSPFSSAAMRIELESRRVKHAEAPVTQLLDGVWELAEGGEDAVRLKGQWADCIPVKVPGSIHTALVEQGVIGDPSYGENAKAAKAYSHKTWWYRCQFDAVPGMNAPKLELLGVSPACEIWLNGQPLGYHNGAFGGPEYDIAAILKERNTLIVKVHPAPQGSEWNCWHSTAVFNCSYGWHYVDLPAVGIWQSVLVNGTPEVSIAYPFAAATSAEHAKQGIIDLSVKLAGQRENWSGTLYGSIEPDNFEGTAHSFAYPLHTNDRSLGLHLQMQVPDPQLWWPLDMGEQPLYQMKLSFVPDNGIPDYKQFVLGIRSIEMGALPEGPMEDKYNWTFIVNGEPFFAKGSGWCTMDALMDFNRERYDHFLSLAAGQHTQLLRAWGGGMPETEDFYDLCDRKGIMVMQEWPTCWNSQKQQPYDVLEETVILNTLRLRNHASLVMWCGGNESDKVEDEAINMMGRYSVELDGTRAFHRSDPWGGSTHDHIVWNGWTPAYSYDYYATLDSMMLNEFGLASAPNLESFRRFMPDAEWKQWPPVPGKSFYQHLPAFDTRNEYQILTEFASSFVKCDSMQSFIAGTQLSQVISLRHKIEHARSRWPKETGIITYKLNDVYIGTSWATVDWYGAPKMGHYFTQDAYAPLTACVIFSKLNSPEQPQVLPVFVLDDCRTLEGQWSAAVRLYNSKLQLLEAHQFDGAGTVDKVRQVGQIELAGGEQQDPPLLLVSEVLKDGAVLHRTFYYFNFEHRQGVLLRLPKTELRVERDAARKRFTVTNVGSLPAVGVEIYQRPDPNATAPLVADDNFFWLEPSESCTIAVNNVEGAAVRCWGAESLTF